MTGRVRCYLPAAGRGVVQTESGDELPFRTSADVADLQGGDIVEFELANDGQNLALNVTLRRRWAEMLNDQHRALVNQFHDTIEIHT